MYVVRDCFARVYVNGYVLSVLEGLRLLNRDG